MDLGTGSVSSDAATSTREAGASSLAAMPDGQTHAVSTPAVETPDPRDAAARAAALARVNRAARVPIGWLWEWAKIFQIAVVLFLVVRAFLVEAYKIPSGSMEGTLLVGDFLLVNKLVYGAEVPFTGRRLPRVEAPARGDVIVFQWPSDIRKNFVKRLVGLPGDTLAMRGGVLYVNGVAQRERYVTHTEPGADPSYEDFRWQRDYVARTAAAEQFPARSVGGTRTAIAAAPGQLDTPIDFLAPVPRPGRNPGDHPSRNNWGPLVVPVSSYFVLGDNRDNSLDSRYWGFVPDSLLRGRPLVVYYSYAPDSARRFDWLTAVRWSRLGERVR
jgi:signal peptidase I